MCTNRYCCHCCFYCFFAFYSYRIAASISAIPSIFLSNHSFDIYLPIYVYLYIPIYKSTSSSAGLPASEAGGAMHPAP
jgi:hypothetical protein